MNTLEHKHSNNDTCSDSLKVESDSGKTPSIIINPPPEDRRCQCCGRHISELEPFNFPEYPHCNGHYLVMNFRRALLNNKEAEEAIFEAEGALYESYEFGDTCGEVRTVQDWLHEKYGEKGLSLYYLGEGSLNISPSWECKDCIVLSQVEYCNKAYRCHDMALGDNNNEK